MTWLRLLGFGLANASVAIFFDGIWLMGYRIKALENFSSDMGYFQCVLWFVSFFMASFLSLKAVVKKWVSIKCLGLALAFSFLLWCLIITSDIALAPIFDPWY